MLVSLHHKLQLSDTRCSESSHGNMFGGQKFSGMVFEIAMTENFGCPMHEYAQLSGHTPPFRDSGP